MNNTISPYIHPSLNHLLEGGRSLIQVETFEEDRLSKLLVNLSEHHGKEFWTWSSSTGLVTPEGPQSRTSDAVSLLRFLMETDKTPLLWVKDLHHLYAPAVIRGLRDLYYHWRDKGGVCVLSATQRAIPQDLEREMALLKLDMPSQVELTEEVNRWYADLDTPPELSASVRNVSS